MKTPITQTFPAPHHRLIISPHRTKTYGSVRLVTNLPPMLRNGWLITHQREQCHGTRAPRYNRCNVLTSSGTIGTNRGAGVTYLSQQSRRNYTVWVRPRYRTHVKFYLCLPWYRNSTSTKIIGLRMALEEFTGIFHFPVNFRCHPQSFWNSTIFQSFYVVILLFRVEKWTVNWRQVLGNSSAWIVVTGLYAPISSADRSKSRYL